MSGGPAISAMRSSLIIPSGRCLSTPPPPFYAAIAGSLWLTGMKNARVAGMGLTQAVQSIHRSIIKTLLDLCVCVVRPGCVN